MSANYVPAIEIRPIQNPQKPAVSAIIIKFFMKKIKTGSKEKNRPAVKLVKFYQYLYRVYQFCKI